MPQQICSNTPISRVGLAHPLDTAFSQAWNNIVAFSLSAFSLPAFSSCHRLA